MGRFDRLLTIPAGVVGFMFSMLCDMHNHNRNINNLSRFKAGYNKPNFTVINIINSRGHSSTPGKLKADKLQKEELFIFWEPLLAIEHFHPQEEEEK